MDSLHHGTAHVNQPEETPGGPFVLFALAEAGYRWSEYATEEDALAAWRGLGQPVAFLGTGAQVGDRGWLAL